MGMKITITIIEALHKSNDWDALCSDIGIDPWCINEGRASVDEELQIEEDVARKHGLI